MKSLKKWSSLLIILLTLLLVPLTSTSECTNRIYERREHNIDEIPYIVYLEMVSQLVPELNPYHAAGIIIDVNMILTLAYHCETAYSLSMRVYAGQTYVNPKIQELHVVEYALHPKRGRKTLDDTGTVKKYRKMIGYNYCLLRLNGSLIWSANVQRAPLPFSYERIERGQQFMVSGWGPYKNFDYLQGRCQMMTGDDTHYTRAGLFFTYSYRTPDYACERSLRKGFFLMHPTVFCLGHPCKDHHTALGDDGGPVMILKSGKVIGMVINMIEVDNDTEYQPNAELSYAADWINEMRVKWVPLADEEQNNKDQEGTTEEY